MPSGWSEPALWNVSSRCRYQQQRSDTDKLGVAQGIWASMNANNSIVPRWQQGRCLAFRQSTWERHVQMSHVANSKQEDDPEHTGQTYFSHSQRQPAHLNGAGARPGDLEGFFSVDPSQVLHLQEARSRCHLSPQALLWAWLQFTGVCFGELGDLLISSVAGMGLASGRKLLASFLSHLVHSS